MRGNFDVSENLYPYGVLEQGDGYAVTDMLELEKLHTLSLSWAAAAHIAKEANHKYRTAELSHIGVRDLVASKIAEILAEQGN